MSQESHWYCTEADEHGFVNFDVLRRKAERMDEAEFVEAFPKPALLVVYKEGDGSMPKSARADQSGVQLLTVAVSSAGVLRYLSRIAFVTKRPGNPYPHLISVGRSSNNDITIAVESVSKVHGYVVVEEDRWYFTDHGSTNGSRLNGHELDKNEKYPLEDGDLLQLGLEVMFEFLHPESLRRRLLDGA